jgi:23S rRNA pseudouridine2605 synthase
MSEERLQKILARAGIASRRKAEELIAKGRVRVDGRVVTELGTRADPRSNRIELDGKRLVAEPLVYGVLHKPRGMVSTLSDPEGRPTVRDLLAPVGVRVVPIGRLDFHTSGTLLFTNDGEFAAKLAHPSTGAPKVYVAKVRGTLDENNLPRWTESIDIDGRGTRPADLRVLRDEGDKTWIQVTLREGRNRQVRRLGDHAGTPVMRLARISQAGITSEGLRPGEWRHLSVDELTTLKKNYGVPKRVRAAVQSSVKPKPMPGTRPARAARSASTSARTARSADAPRWQEGGKPSRASRALAAPTDRSGGAKRGSGAEPRAGKTPSRSAERSQSRSGRTEAPRGERARGARASRTSGAERTEAPRGERARGARASRTSGAERTGNAAARPHHGGRAGGAATRSGGTTARAARGTGGRSQGRRPS